MDFKTERKPEKKPVKRSVNKPEKKAKKSYKLQLILVVAAAAVVLGIYLGVGFYYNGRFAPGTVINGVEAQGKTVSQVEQILSDKAGEYKLDITVDGQVVDTITASEVGLVSHPLDGEIQGFLDSQSGFDWPIKLSNPDSFTGERLVSYDKNLLINRINGLNCVRKTPQKYSKDAHYELDGDTFVIVEEVYGDQVDPNFLAKGLEDPILNLRESCDLKEDKLYVQPEVTKDDPGLISKVQELNNVASIKINYTVGETIDKTLITRWMVVDEAGNISFDNEKILEFVKEMGSKYNTVGQPKDLKTSYGNVVKVPGGNYGWKIENDKEVEEILNNLYEGKDVTRDFVYFVEANSHDGADYGNSYVEVNLSTQHMFLYVDGKLVIDSDFVSGNISRGMGTHTGAYRITYTQKNAVLRGEGYATPVSYWMPFNNGEGLHDATWRGAFGGNIYKTNGSHGCVNLPFSVAKTVFENVKTGFPVLVYAAEGYTPGSPTPPPAEVTATTVINEISLIGPVTLESETAIAKARADYNKLTDTEKAKVTNITILDAAEADLQRLKATGGAPSSETPGGEVPGEVPAPETVPQTTGQAQTVISMIDNLGIISLANESAINSARAAYNALPDSEKAKVVNIAVLTSAESTIQALKNLANEPQPEPVPEAPVTPEPAPQAPDTEELPLTPEVPLTPAP